MRLKKIVKILVIVLGILVLGNFVQAGLGISPPLVKNHHLLRGSHFEQTVHLSRGDPRETLLAQVEIDAPEIKDWISIRPGMEFTLPAGQHLVPVTVVINVPQDAELGQYKGHIRIKTMPERPEPAPVIVALGARVDLDLKVVEEEFLSFNIRTWEILPLEEGWPVKIAFTIENVGNVKARPLKVLLDVYDHRNEILLASGEVTDLDYVEPFATQQIIAEFPIDLAEGRYWARVKVYKDEKEVIEYSDGFDVLAKGTLAKPGQGWIFWILIGVGIVILAGIGYGIWRRKKK